MRRFLIVCCLPLIFSAKLFSQTATIHGTVKDANTGEVLESVAVLQPPVNGITTGINGSYELKVVPGNVNLIFSYIGLVSDTEHFQINAGEIKELNILLTGNASELQTIVVTENKFGEKIQKITQSVDVIKPRMLESNNITNMIDGVSKLPGVTMLDGQISIRGGSGYAYGAGSRVTLVVDDMPLMTADRQDIKWPFVPVENAEQVELVKGASSMQYGASALDGVLNVTTAYARDTPVTRFTFFYEGMGKPSAADYKWWKRDGNFFQNPNRAGMSFMHSEKSGDFEWAYSGMLQGQQSYLQNDNEYFTRFNGKFRWHPKKHQRLTVEFNASVLYDYYNFQLYWLDNTHPYIASPGVTLSERFFYAYFDPKVKYIDKKGNEHKIYSRVYRQYDLDGVSNFWIYSLNYQFRHDFGKLIRLLAGVNNDHYTLTDATLGNHNGDFGGGFVQAQLNYKFFTLNAGVREEYVHEDKSFTPTMPVFRAGASFQIKKYNYLRLSFGQAFRIPSIAEKFVDITYNQLEIAPNKTLKPEAGYTAEIGYKRSLKIGNWLGYFDAAVFWTQFRNMIEFELTGIHSTPTGPVAVFQSQNISNARIFGWELTFYGEGHIAPNVDVTALIGYTYYYGADLNDPIGPNNRNVGSFLKNAFTHYILPTRKSDADWDAATEGMLKYRYPHQIKADVDFIFHRKYHLGSSLQYYSYMTQIDYAFLILIPGVDQYRIDTRNKGSWIWDLRAGYELNRNIGLNFLVKNILNTYYTPRPGRPAAPISYSVQLVVNFGGKHNAVNLPSTSNM